MVMQMNDCYRQKHVTKKKFYEILKICIIMIIIKHLKMNQIAALRLVGWILWHINLCRLINTKSHLHIYTSPLA